MEQNDDDTFESVDAPPTIKEIEKPPEAALKSRSAVT
jgi:hypothetical protein